MGLWFVMLFVIVIAISVTASYFYSLSSASKNKDTEEGQKEVLKIQGPGIVGQTVDRRMSPRKIYEKLSCIKYFCDRVVEDAIANDVITLPELNLAKATIEMKAKEAESIIKKYFVPSHVASLIESNKCLFDSLLDKHFAMTHSSHHVSPPSSPTSLTEH